MDNIFVDKWIEQNAHKEYANILFIFFKLIYNTK